MRVTPEELRGLVVDNETWHTNKGEHPTAFISDELFDRILDDLHSLAATESGQEVLF